MFVSVLRVVACLLGRLFPGCGVLLLIVRCAVMLDGSLFWVGYAVGLVFCFWLGVTFGGCW